MCCGSAKAHKDVAVRGLREARTELDDEELRAWEALFCGAATGARVAAFRHLRNWCAASDVDLWAMTWADVEKYLHSPTRAGKTNAARSRLFQLQFMAVNWWLPVPVGDRLPRPTEMDDNILEEGQALAIDPCFMLAVEDQAGIMLTWGHCLSDDVASMGIDSAHGENALIQIYSFDAISSVGRLFNGQASSRT